MIKHFFLPLVLIALSQVLEAQQAFTLYLDSDSSSSSSGQVQKPFETGTGDNYFFAIHDNSSVIVKTDENGILLWTKSLYSSWLPLSYTFTKYQDDVLAMSVSTDTITLIKLDASGNEQWVKKLIKNPTFTVKNFLVTADLKIVIAGNTIVTGIPVSISVYACDSISFGNQEVLMGVQNSSVSDYKQYRWQMEI